MTVWFVSRHPGALEWVKRQHISVDRAVEHLSIDEIQKGDTVIGVLPMGLAADVCSKGANFVSLDFSVPRELRGKELSADSLDRMNCRLQPFYVQKKD